MKILNFGSLNIDHVYQLDHFVQPGETMACTSYKRFCGGKGLNQSIALARAGAHVYHAGQIGTDGIFLQELLNNQGVDTQYVVIGDNPTGHAIIQVAEGGENSIVIAGGANICISPEAIDDTIAAFDQGDCLLLQNEVSFVDTIIERGAHQGLRIVFNPAPFTHEVLDFPLHLVDLFILNETEAAAITGTITLEDMIEQMAKSYPDSATIFTMGSKGALFVQKDIRHHIAASQVTAVDSTGAGDTFIGYFLATYTSSGDIPKALATASAAAAISVTRYGAADSIPTHDDVIAFLEKMNNPESS